MNYLILVMVLAIVIINNADDRKGLATKTLVVLIVLVLYLWGRHN